MQLYDNSIIPSFLSVVGDSPSGNILAMSENSLRVGMVSKIYFPEDENNLSKKFIEYDVSVEKQSLGVGQTTITYPRCQVMSLFGALADYFQWTPRAADIKVDETFGLGSYVLIACINDDTTGAVIIGGVNHPKKDKKYKNNGHHLNFEYNGIYCNIDKDGALSLIHRGATDASGKVTDETGKNSSIQFNKDGDIILGYNIQKSEDTEVASNTDELPFLKLLKNDKKISLFANSDIQSQSKARFVVKTTSGVKINPDGLQQQSFLRATAYRQQEQLMHQQMQIQLQTLATLIQTAATAITTAATAITTMVPLLAIPIAGPIATAPLHAAAGASLLSAGVALNGASPIITMLKTAIQSFEQQNSTYLSSLHSFSDSPP